MITQDLIRRIFSAANISRWNDHVRPFDFAELDKQAHKMIIAYVLAKFEEDSGNKIDWQKLIEGGIFELFQRIMLTDLKPEVFHEIMSKKSAELNKWVIKNLHSDIAPVKGGFEKRLEEYFFKKNYAPLEKRILAAAHVMSTKWEFGIIYPLNLKVYGIARTKKEIDASALKFNDLAGMKKLASNKKFYAFLGMCAQLRFQQRWAQAFRVPKTTVLGHMLIVAIFSYISSLELGACNKRLYNNFFSGLFHDLPEILTRDIVRPVKNSISGLEDIIRLYETKQVHEKILPLIPKKWHPEMKYFIEDEFSNKIMPRGKALVVESIGAKNNTAAQNPTDGKLIEICDKFSAYIEASLALESGIKSPSLLASKKALYKAFAFKTYEGIKFKRVFDYFA
ncbi:MAG: HD domain-containing protein [Elusimicrobia bacterium]|nr:HD domain-containing protein [Elusimicrobiota bacterium]